MPLQTEALLHERLTGIDKKLEKLTELITKLALIEQQNTYIQRHIMEHEQNLDGALTRLQKIENFHSQLVGVVIGIGAVAGAISSQLFKLLLGP